MELKIEFTDIDHFKHDNKVQLVAFDYVNEISVDVDISYDLLVQWFPREFKMYKQVSHNGSAPEYVPTDSLAPLDLWYQEHMDIDKAWKLFEMAKIENLTFNTIS